MRRRCRRLGCTRSRAFTPSSTPHRSEACAEVPTNKRHHPTPRLAGSRFEAITTPSKGGTFVCKEIDSDAFYPSDEEIDWSRVKEQTDGRHDWPRSPYRRRVRKRTPHLSEAQLFDQIATKPPPAELTAAVQKFVREGKRRGSQVSQELPEGMGRGAWLLERKAPA